MILFGSVLGILFSDVILPIEDLPILAGESTIYLGHDEGGLYENVLSVIESFQGIDAY